MKLAAIALVLAAAACGGKKSSTAPTNTGGTAGGVPAQWAEVMVEGATFKLDNSDMGVEGEPIVVIATVTKVTRDAGGATAELSWKDPTGEDTGNGLPTLIKVSGANVWFGSAGSPLDGDNAVAFPPPADGETAAGLYAHEQDGTFCYGEGPGEGAGECEDVCFAELCVAAGAGITSGSGTWWPNYEMFGLVAH